jgi:hypothetical protein
MSMFLQVKKNQSSSFICSGFSLLVVLCAKWTATLKGIFSIFDLIVLFFFFLFYLHYVTLSQLFGPDKSLVQRTGNTLPVCSVFLRMPFLGSFYFTMSCFSYCIYIITEIQKLILCSFLDACTKFSQQETWSCFPKTRQVALMP